MSDVVIVNGVTAVRWTAAGKDRWYVKDAAGLDLGWLDVPSDRVTTIDPAWEPTIRQAVSEVTHHAALSPELQTSPAVPPSNVVETEMVEVDLAANRPGQAARARADEELAAMRERSRFRAWLARVTDAKTDERAWRIGADGEEALGARLDKLTAHGWHVLHAVPVGAKDSDIDHVLIGPGGVFTINTKTHPGKRVWVGGGTIMVGGQRVPYVRNSEHEAERASKLLTAACGFPVFATAALVFVRAANLTVKTRPDHVLVLGGKQVPRFFLKRPDVLATEQIAAIFDAARRPSTWTSSRPR